MQLNLLNIWTGGSAVLLIGSEAVFVAGAAIWAVSGLAGFAPHVAFTLIAAAIASALAGTALFARMVHKAEPFFEHQQVPGLEANVAVPARNGRAS